MDTVVLGKYIQCSIAMMFGWSVLTEFYSPNSRPYAEHECMIKVARGPKIVYQLQNQVHFVDWVQWVLGEDAHSV